ncbi:MAG: DUF5686 and carboxypeptidase regulatory-like domain-containing protein [Bacteroidales bacterium]|nr:DUF5686 and carboxypeptidase regulatory-like domain-containing protein [Bacteroidales bacterium]
MKLLYRYVLLLFIFLYSCSGWFELYGQGTGLTEIKGIVTDELTGDPIHFVSVYLKGKGIGTLTDEKGRYLIETNTQASTIVFSFVGYNTESRSISPGREQTINISLSLASIALNEVVVKAEKKAYRNRNNPAVSLINNVIAHKDENSPDIYDFLEYKKYEKIQFAISNISEKLKSKSSSGKFEFIFRNIDTTRRIGNNILPIFIKESISDHYFRKEPEASKDIIIAEKTVNLDEYIDKKGVTNYLNYLYQDVNIYDAEIFFLTTKFLSPIARTAPAFYRFYIIDTLPLNELKCVRLFFEPRNKSDFLFHGNIYVTLDSSYAVRRIDMGINKGINLDWIQDIIITQDFDTFGHDAWLLSKEEISVDVGIAKSTTGVYGQRTTYFKNYKINEPVSELFLKGAEKTEKPDPASSIPDYWNSNRFVPLTKQEMDIYSTIDSLKNLPAFRRRMDFALFLTSGYLKAGKFELGPSNSFYSYNRIEGQRFRVGARTSTLLSKKITLDGYTAFGVNDKRFKYGAGVTYSFTPRSIYEFPVKSIKVSYMKDIRIPGQELLFLTPDNLFFSLKRGVNDKFLLNRTFKIEHLNEFKNHFSYQTGYSFTRQSPEGNLYFNTDNYGPGPGETGYIDISEFFVNFRYAPDETFYEGKVWRSVYPGKKPIYQLKIAGGSTVLFNDYDYLKLQLNVTRRYIVSIIGYTDITFEAGKIFGKVPYPLLYAHRANQTYSYQKQSYNLMNFLEFVSDRYVSLNADYCFNGFIFNKIPLIKKLKLREWVTFKVLYGGLLTSNDPDYHDDLFRFPLDSYGVPLTYTLEKKPYIEASIGVANIFNLLRVDLIKRFTYLDNPNVSELGVRILIKIDI